MVGGSVPRGPIERRRRTFAAALALATVLISGVVAAGSGPAAAMVVTAQADNYGISVTKTATPSVLPEPGGSFTVTIVVTNTSTDPVPLVVENLSDSVHGNLDGMGSCEVGASLPTIGSQYTCSFTSSFIGDAGASQTDEVAVVAKPVDGIPTIVFASATVTITDVIPTATVTKTATPATLPAPGGSFTFTVAVTNTSPEPVQLSGLTDDVYGDLNGQGTCATGGAPIAPGEAVTCTFPGTFNGSAGDAQTDTVTATVTDDEDNASTASAGATVALTATPATGGGDEPAARAAGPQPLRRGALARTGAALGSPAGVAGGLLIAGLLLVGVGRQRRPRRRTAR